MVYKWNLPSPGFFSIYSALFLLQLFEVAMQVDKSFCYKFKCVHFFSSQDWDDWMIEKMK